MTDKASMIAAATETVRIRTGFAILAGLRVSSLYSGGGGDVAANMA